MNKSEIKREYKVLVKLGKEEEANKLLDKIRLGEPLLAEKPKKKEKPKVKKKEEGLEKLKKIKGIGNKTIKDIKRICNSMDELKMLLKNDQLPLRDDIVIKLKNHLEDVDGGN